MMAFPTIQACFLCELVRPEPMGKFSVLGYYGLTPYARVGVSNFSLPLLLCFVFAGGQGSGHFRIELRITAPNGASFEAQPAEGDLSAHSTLSNIFMGFNGILPGPGEYTVSLLVDGAPYFQTQFALERMSTPPARSLFPPAPVRTH